MESIEKKPQDGEFVAHCAHVKVPGVRVSWYWCEDTVFQMGEAEGKVDWFCICDSCESDAGNDVSRVPLTGVAVFHVSPQPTLVSPPALA